MGDTRPYDRAEVNAALRRACNILSTSDPHDLLSLGQPPQGTAKTGDLSLLHACADLGVKAWFDFVEGPLWTHETLGHKRPRKAPTTPADAWTSALAGIASHFDACFDGLFFRKLPSGKSTYPGVLEPRMVKPATVLRRNKRSYLHMALNPPMGAPLYRNHASRLSLEYFNCLNAAWALRLMHGMPEASYVVNLAARHAHENAHWMVDVIRHASPEPLRALAARLLESSLARLAEVYTRDEDMYDPRVTPGPFSALRVHDIPALAERKASMHRRYGRHQLATAFEHQLALLVQSLGFVVVNSRVAERTVDLVCIAGQAAPFSFLLEAKTSIRPYTLPVDDARALSEYVDAVRRTLTPLPRLRFALLVGPSPAPTLSTRLNRLQADIGLATHFCSAVSLANLRQSLIGPLPADDFLDAIGTASAILPDDFFTTIVGRARSIQAAYANFVRTLLPPRGYSNR